MPPSPRVFISYSHDSEGHKEDVLRLANRLRGDGIDCRIDRYEVFPESGWPRWMAKQIEEADFVLVVCTEQYARRVCGDEEHGVGLGASWEGQLITQEVYDSGGRNSKFVPVTLRADDRRFMPKFLEPATNYCLQQEGSDEHLLRLLTAQPAVLMPALGPLRIMEPLRDNSPTEAATARTFATTTSVSIVWRLPRGFLLIEKVVASTSDSWALVATYFDYEGNDKGATHYHDSYRWNTRERREGQALIDEFEVQFRKLAIPVGDWLYARGALNLMVDIRRGTYSVSEQCEINGWQPRPSLYVSVHPAGSMRLPRCPSEYVPLVAAGAVRDLAAEAQGVIDDGGFELGAVCAPWTAELIAQVSRIRREARIEVGRRLDPSHPASKNLEEIIIRYKPENQSSLLPWLKEFREAVCEAAGCIEAQVS